jgi:UDP-N-acetylglucosamine transferase subunit ALG13
VILVTLGTHPQPMDRVVTALDDLIERRAINERVIIQAASFNLLPKRAEAVAVAGYDALAAWAAEATVVVTHGGPGSIMLALGAGRRPVIVPRMVRYGEHVDDHQLRFARWIAPRRGLQLVEDVATLGGAIEEARSATVDAGTVGPSAAVIERLRTAIEGAPRR